MNSSINLLIVRKKSLHLILIFRGLLDHLSCFIPLFFKYFSSFLNFLLLLDNPSLKFLPLYIISSGGHLISFVHFLKQFFFFLFSKFNCVFTHFKHLGIVVHVKIFAVVQFTRKFLK